MNENIPDTEDNTMTKPTVIEKIEALSQRLERAREIVADNKVKRVLGVDDHYTVESSTGTGTYLINGNCSCPDARQRDDLTKGLCKHKLATLLYLEANPEPNDTDQDKRDLGW